MVPLELNSGMRMYQIQITVKNNPLGIVGIPISKQTGTVFGAVKARSALLLLAHIMQSPTSAQPAEEPAAHTTLPVGQLRHPQITISQFCYVCA